MKKRFLALLMALIMMMLPLCVGAEEGSQEGYTEIHTVEDLFLLEKHPEGHFRLMEDLDLTDVVWSCPSFSGIFDGNDHSLLNLSITCVGKESLEVLDGNQKPYEAVFSGFFGTLNRAEIRNLHLVNLKLLVQTNQPCMVGGIAGYAMDSNLYGCSVTGRLELRAHEKIFGMGGLVGYGVAMADHCTVDAELICVDTDAETSDEQFLGGVFGSGFMSVKDCDVTLRAYISEHGYVHSGGVGGMMMQYPIGMGRQALLQNNRIGGKITFFEDSRSRRAYCRAIIGELVKNMNYNYSIGENTYNDFQSEEIKEFDRELRPEACEKPNYTQKVVPGDCQNFGYTQLACSSCGYSYRDHYTLGVHTVKNWVSIIPATTTEEGESKGFCTVCGARQTRVDPTLPEATEPETTLPPEPTLPETTAPATEPAPGPEPAKREGQPMPGWAKWMASALAVIAVGALIFVLTEPKGKHLRKNQRTNSK